MTEQKKIDLTRDPFLWLSLIPIRKKQQQKKHNQRVKTVCSASSVLKWDLMSCFILKLPSCKCRGCITRKGSMLHFYAVWVGFPSTDPNKLQHITMTC